MKKIITPLILVAIIGSIAFTLFKNKQEMEVKAEASMKTSQSIPVQTELVSKSIHRINFTSNGTFEPSQELNLQSEASGRVLEIYKRKGAYVKKGDLIAKLDDELLQPELTMTEVRLEQSKRDLARYENLAGTDAITKKQLEEFQNNTKTIAAELKMIQKRLANSLITAPISGYINQDYIEIGTLLSPGMQIVDIVNTQPLKLVIKVSESEIAQISKGDLVSIRSGVFPDEEFNGKVSFLSSKGDASLRYEVEIEVKENTDRIKPGMFGYAIFNYDRQEAVMITRKSLASGLKDPEVYVVEDGKAVLKKVKLAPIGQDQLVLLDGLREGEKLVVSGLINLRDGIPVTEL